MEDLKQLLQDDWGAEGSQKTGREVQELLKKILSALLNDSDTFKQLIDIITESNTVSSISSIPVDKRLVIATITEDGSFSLASTLENGKEIHVIVKNTAGEAKTITLPNDGGYICLVDSALSIDADSYAEINVISDGENMYIRAL